MNASKTTLLIAALTAAGFVSSASAAPVIYEPFDYNGSVVGTATSSDDIGFAAGEWSTSGSNVYEYTTGLTFPGLTVDGGSVRRPTNSGNSEMNRTIAAASTTALTTPGTVYFSALIRVGNSSGNANAGLVFGTHAVDAGDEPLGATDGAQEGLGFSINNNDLYAIAFDDGVRSQSTGSLGVNGNSTEFNTTFMIVGQIDWGATDTLTLYNVTDVNAALPASFASVSGDLAESAFTTLALGDRQSSNIDEIRFGTSLADVGLVPEPSSLALMGLGGLLVARRRRSN